MRLHKLFKNKSIFEPIYQYSDDPILKRQQVWQNLKEGLLIEDTAKFIPWNTTFYDLTKYQEKRRDSGDRTEWYLGNHKILDGYEAHLEAMKWIDKPYDNPVAVIYTNFGADFEGQVIFNHLRVHLTKLLGEPAQIDLEEWGSFELGTITWEQNNVKVSLTAIEIFNVRYKLSVGYKNNPNDIVSAGLFFNVYLWFCMKFNIDVSI
jgi:hypothetical protein